MSGAELIASTMNNILDANAVVYGVPRSPITEITNWSPSHTFNQHRCFVGYEEVDVIWRLIGINAHEITTVRVMKHTGFLTVLEMMVISVNQDLRAPFVVIDGDEVGATSQTSNDTRHLCESCHIPVVEPSYCSIPESFAFCLELSSQLRKPVVYRVVSDLVNRKYKAAGRNLEVRIERRCFGQSDYFASEELTLDRYAKIKAQKQKLASLLARWNVNNFSSNRGSYLVIAADNIFDRVYSVVANLIPNNLDSLEINIVNLLPEVEIVKNLKNYDKASVLGSWKVYLETEIRNFVQRYELNFKVLGRENADCGQPFIC